MADSKKFFEKVVKQKKFVLRPNIRKEKFNHPDLFGISNNIDDDGSEYIIYGWIVYDKKIKAKVLNVVMSKREDQEYAQKLFKQGSTETKIDNPSFKIEDEDSSSFGRIQQLIRELGEDLKPRPANYPIEDYIKAVARRIRDNSTNTVKVAVRLNKELIRDDYGELESRFPTIAFKEEVAFYGSFKYDWAKAIIPFNDRDKTDYEFYSK